MMQQIMIQSDKSPINQRRTKVSFFLSLTENIVVAALTNLAD